MNHFKVPKIIIGVALLAVPPWSATTRAQVLNTRPLSQPYTNPSSPNAGAYGSRSAPSYRDLSPQKEYDARKATPPGLGQGSCWTDSIGKRHCRK
jgi:hypothetical protein